MNICAMSSKKRSSSSSSTAHNLLITMRQSKRIFLCRSIGTALVAQALPHSSCSISLPVAFSTADTVRSLDGAIRQSRQHCPASCCVQFIVDFLYTSALVNITAVSSLSSHDIITTSKELRPSVSSWPYDGCTIENSIMCIFTPRP
jgi:hypothetical protein